MEVTIWMVAFITILLNLANAAKLDSVKNSH
jgi:hypothetical protein